MATVIIRVGYSQKRNKIYIKLINSGVTAPLAKFNINNAMLAMTYAENVKKVLGENVYIDYQGSIFNESGC